MSTRQISLAILSGRIARAALCGAATLLAVSAYAQSGMQGSPYQQPGMQGAPYPQPGMGGMGGMPGSPYPQTGMQGSPYPPASMSGMQGSPYPAAGMSGMQGSPSYPPSGAGGATPVVGTSYPPQEGTPLQPGEAVVTRFSGTAMEGPQGSIDTNGPSSVIIGVTGAQEPPQGQHWVNKPIRTAATAAQVGQVFGVALDEQTPPNIYLSATAAFGLHTQQGSWMPGMWGPGGGPGTVWRLDAAGGYRAVPFTDIRLNGRPNSGAALGNIAYDRINRQLFVSDMETGMIHRVGVDGREMGAFDHGVTGRMQFTDAENGQRGSLAPIPFDPNSNARVQNCSGPFDQTPACWNIAASGRRVWGLGVRRDPMGEGARLYYGVWSSPAFGQSGWHQLSDEEKRNSVWSIRLGPGGDFDPSDVRREFLMPDFFQSPQDIERAGFSQPVSDISFAECDQRPVMLVSERGGMRNLGLTAENAFATPGESRTLRYELDQQGAWRAVGRYDVGNDDRRSAGPPFMRANCAGGAAFGPALRAAAGQPGGPAATQSVWITGDNLCSPQGPCRLPGQSAIQPAATGGGQDESDPSQVHGAQGHSADLIAEVQPMAGRGGAPAQGASSQALENAYLVDADQVVDVNGQPVEQEFDRNDATRVGDIAIYQVCAAPAPFRPASPGLPWVNPTYLIPPPPTDFVVPDHHPDDSHAQWASHGTRTSHFRFGSHSPSWSHQRWRSHWTYWSHSRRESHNPRWSHNRIGSHNRWVSGGHDERGSHFQYRSHSLRWSHNPRISGGHDFRGSHLTHRSHSPRVSHSPYASGGHDFRRSHTRYGSHAKNLSHNPQLSGGHDYRRSQGHDIRRSQGHDIRRSQGHDTHRSQGTQHSAYVSQGHDARRSGGIGTHHNPAISQGGIHSLQQSRGHSPTLSRGHRLPASPGHNVVRSQGSHHNAYVSRGGSQHNAFVSRGGSQHNAYVSRGGSRHNAFVSRGGSRHNAYLSRGGSRVHHPPRIHQQRFTPQRFHTPRIQRQRFNAPRVQRQRFNAPRYNRAPVQRRVSPQRTHRFR